MSAPNGRRRFVRQVAALGTITVLSRCVPSPRPATPAARHVVLGYLSHGISEQIRADCVPFRDELRELGYVEGADLTIDLRTAENDTARLPGLASELIHLPVDVLVTQSSPATIAAKPLTSSLPIVFIRVADPIGLGIVPSLARPGGNVTGVSVLSGPNSTKNVELLQQIVPGLRRIAVLVNASNPGNALVLKETEDAARVLGIQLQTYAVHDLAEVNTALAAIPGSKPDGLLILPSFTLTPDLGLIPRFAEGLRLPQVYNDPQFVKAGGLMSSGVNLSALARRAAQLVDKILKGANPADLPVEVPRQFDLTINQSTAQRLGLTIPDAVWRQATEVVH